MPRRGGVPKRDVLPDPIYGSKVVTKLINHVMLDGKKGTAQSIVYEAFDIMKEKLGQEPMDIFNQALENVKPLEAYDKMKEHIAYFHIKDALFEGAIVPPGKGDANIKEILELHLNSNSDDLFVTLEPHLQTFNGLNALVGRSFDNPYKYEDEKTAFSDAVVKFRELI